MIDPSTYRLLIHFFILIVFLIAVDPHLLLIHSALGLKLSLELLKAICVHLELGSFQLLSWLLFLHLLSIVLLDLELLLALLEVRELHLVIQIISVCILHVLLVLYRVMLIIFFFVLIRA